MDLTYILLRTFLLIMPYSLASIPDLRRRKIEITPNECTAGTPGPRGPQGPSGPPGEEGIPVAVKTNWRQCVWDSLLATQDSGTIVTCNFTKEHPDTSIYVAWSGSSRFGFESGSCGRWFFTFNGEECSSPDTIEGVYYASGYSSHRIIRSRVIFGHCNNLPEGPIQVGFNVGNCKGYEESNCLTGWNSATRIMVEEKTPSPYA